MGYELQDDGLVIFTTARTERVAMNNNFKPTAKPSKVKIKQFLAGNKFFSPWGDDNLWPTTVMDALKGCAPAQVAIEILTTLLYGNGIGVYKYEGKKVVKVFKKEQREWFRQTFIQNYIMQATTDYFTLGNQFGQPIKNRAGTGFAMIANISSPFNRVSPYSNASGSVPSVFIHGSWDAMPEEKECEKLTLLSPLTADDILEENKETKKFMWQTGSYTPGNIFYHDHPWHALVRNGTLDIFPEIPKIRKRRIKDAMFIKYHVRINEIYWWLQYGGMEKGKAAWEALTPDERKKKRNELYTSIDNKLAGSDNAFKSIYTPTFIEPRTGTEIKLIQIDKIETEVGESAAFDPDKQSNVADIFLAFTIPSAVANTVLSDTKSRGGGSDIAEGNRSVIARLQMHRDNIFAPVDWCMRNTIVNGQPLLADDEFLGAENDLLTTLDKSPTGMETSAAK